VTALQEFRCEVCGIVSSDPIHCSWFDVEIPSLLCSDGILRLPKLPEPDITAGRLTPRCTSVAGLNRFAHRRSQVSCNGRPATPKNRQLGKYAQRSSLSSKAEWTVGATSSSARPPETGVRIPLLRGRPQYPRIPGERGRDTCCGACEWLP
jgi:hypothetical protein